MTGGITEEEAAHVLAHYGEGGFRAGSFTMALIELMIRADVRNLGLLSIPYPGYGEAVRTSKRIGGIHDLRKIAGPLAGRGQIDRGTA
jgi:hypothetical protein